LVGELTARGARSERYHHRQRFHGHDRRRADHFYL